MFFQGAFCPHRNKLSLAKSYSVHNKRKQTTKLLWGADAVPLASLLYSWCPTARGSSLQSALPIFAFVKLPWTSGLFLASCSFALNGPVLLENVVGRETSHTSVLPMCCNPKIDNLQGALRELAFVISWSQVLASFQDWHPSWCSGDDKICNSMIFYQSQWEKQGCTNFLIFKVSLTFLNFILCSTKPCLIFSRGCSPPPVTVHFACACCFASECSSWSPSGGTVTRVCVCSPCRDQSTDDLPRCSPAYSICFHGRSWQPTLLPLNS